MMWCRFLAVLEAHPAAWREEDALAEGAQMAFERYYGAAFEAARRLGQS